MQTALPTLVGGLDANAQDPGGASSLQSALQQHAGTNLLDGGVNIDDVDGDDGDRIVGNVFGDNKDQVISTLGGVQGAGGGDLMQKVLPMLAPIVMAFLAKQFMNRPAGGDNTAAAGPGGGLGDLLGGLLGGGGGGGAGGGLGSILNSALGGGSGGGQGGGLGDLLGGLLGGGKR